MSSLNIQTHERLDFLRKDTTGEHTKDIPLDGSFVILSDMHLGDGRGADNFFHNEQVFLKALNFYREKDFSLILLGDVEEYWQFNQDEIQKRYGETIYQALQSFPKDRIHRVFGNHDIEWEEKGTPEAVRLGDDIFLTHGHQGDLMSSKLAALTRLTLRLFRYIEPLARRLGLKDPSATQSQVPKHRERELYAWAKKNKKLLITGHTHRATFVSLSYIERLQITIQSLESKDEVSPEDTERLKKMKKVIRYEKRRGREIDSVEEQGKPLPCYFNSGCALYNDGVTALELEDGAIRLIKWDNRREERSVYEEGRVSEFVQKIKYSV